MVNVYPSNGEYAPPMFTVSISADELQYAAGSELTKASVELIDQRNQTLAEIQRGLVDTSPEDFDAAMVARVYSVASSAIKWEEEYQGTQVGHVPLPDELNSEPDSFAGVAMQSSKDGSVQVFSYAEWFKRSDGHNVPGLLVRERGARPEDANKVLLS